MSVASHMPLWPRRRQREDYYTRTSPREYDPLSERGRDKGYFSNNGFAREKVFIRVQGTDLLSILVSMRRVLLSRACGTKRENRSPGLILTKDIVGIASFNCILSRCGYLSSVYLRTGEKGRKDPLNVCKSSCLSVVKPRIKLVKSNRERRVANTNLSLSRLPILTPIETSRFNPSL